MPAPRFLKDKLCPVSAKRERRKEARPGELLEAALDLFVEKGFAATRSEEVAARAGVSKGTLFLYFQSKEELFKAVVIENLAGRFTEWNREFDQFEGSTADMLRYCMRVWWERVGSTQASGLTKLMMSEGRNFPAARWCSPATSCCGASCSAASTAASSRRWTSTWRSTPSSRP